MYIRTTKAMYVTVITPVPYCYHAFRRPLSVVCLLDYLHFRILLKNRLIDFDETWYGWSTQIPLQVLLFFGQISRADPGLGTNRSIEVVASLKKILQTTATNWTQNNDQEACGKKCCYFWFHFGFSFFRHFPDITFSANFVRLRTIEFSTRNAHMIHLVNTF